MVALLRTIRLDPSDTILFSPAAEPGEWAVPGGFLFHGRPFDSLSRKERVAFRSAFLGIGSFGFSTLAVVTPATPAQVQAATDALAAAFVARLGAPDMATAQSAAAEEIAFAAELCRDHDEGRLIALHREQGEGDRITERFRALRPREGSAFAGQQMAGHDRAFHFVETDDESAEDGPAENFNLFDSVRHGDQA